MKTSFIQIRVSKHQKELIKLMAQNGGYTEKQLSLYCRKKLLKSDNSLRLLKEVHKEIMKK